MPSVNHRPIPDLTYPGSDSPSQSLDLYLPLNYSQSPTKLIIYVHGGAWRTGDKADHYSRGLIENLSSHFPTCAISSINYRLSIVKNTQTADVKHPAHNLDVVKSINHASSLPELGDIQETYLMGHSVGAFICVSIAGIMEPPPQESPGLSVPKKISGLILIDGIYDLVQLIEEYPSYHDFVSAAFEERAHDPLTYLAEVSPLSWSAASSKPDLPKILITHSKQDTLLSLRQSQIAAASLESKLNLGDKLQVDFESVSGDHDELLLSPELALRIKSFIHD